MLRCISDGRARVGNLFSLLSQMNLSKTYILQIKFFILGLPESQVVIVYCLKFSAFFVLSWQHSLIRYNNIKGTLKVGFNSLEQNSRPGVLFFSTIKSGRQLERFLRTLGTFVPLLPGFYGSSCLFVSLLSILSGQATLSSETEKTAKSHFPKPQFSSKPKT